MKKLLSVLAVLTLILGSLGLWTEQPAQAAQLDLFNLPSSTVLAQYSVERRNPADRKLNSEYGQKLDLNNANMRLFRQYRGFYPTLAQKIIKNAPYDEVEDVLDIPGLSERQKKRLEANLDNFTVTKQADVFNEGAERLNNGNY